MTRSGDLEADLSASESKGEAPPAKRKRGRPAIVTGEQICETALEMGVATITMTSVASQLGVNHATLYRYVTSRDDLVRQAIDLAVSRTDFPEPSDDGWQDFLYKTANALCGLLDQYPGIATELAGGTFTHQVLHRGAEMMAGLVQMGFTPTNAVLAMDLITDLVVDHVRKSEQLDGRVPSQSMPSRDELAKEWTGPTDTSEEEASLGDIIAAGRAAIGIEPHEWLDNKLRILLAGIGAEIAPR
ncbi:TetR/AcrR family transcriptional regulator C-terminal domain-containing protein [Hoyosella sp. YIM 151337]|uniref:TetR/AcrR family transcriptional regulator n=1 Tax=Hoyosella sp. YIM 151337 TaxID=2992742 RepID=UPI002236BEA8|nr:TetR/AcrR family transcriptional regulator [Hoyosella sp. YIM 151337]MCW4354802.1 TetR/AcrR family transcriptional regulator C-terminal domain-containing protein [Hoyosella sp. YIM 151337]